MADIKIIKNPKGYDHDNIEFISFPFKGSGYIGKKSKDIGLTRCPVCNKENWAMSVADGICAWCGYSVHKINFKY